MAKFDIHKALREAKNDEELSWTVIEWIEDHDLHGRDLSDLQIEIGESVEAVRLMAKALLPPGWYIGVKDVIGYVIEDKEETIQIVVRFRQVEDIINNDDAKAAMLEFLTNKRWSALCGDFDWLLGEKEKV